MLFLTFYIFQKCGGSKIDFTNNFVLRNESEEALDNGSRSTDVRKLDIIRFKRSADEEWTTGEILSRAGKSSEKFSNWWNIKNIQSGHQKPENIEQFAIIEKVTVEENPGQTDEIATYAVNIPFWRFHERECVMAKRTELEKFDEFDVYDEVVDEGQKTIGCRWVLTEKFKEGKKCVKARLCVRGDLEDTQEIRTDSPTVRKGNINILLVVAILKAGLSLRVM